MLDYSTHDSQIKTQIDIILIWLGWRRHETLIHLRKAIPRGYDSINLLFAPQIKTEVTYKLVQRELLLSFEKHAHVLGRAYLTLTYSNEVGKTDD